MTTSSKNTVLVCLPGALGIAEDFNFMSRLNHPDFDCIAIQYPGHGGTALPEKLNTDTLLTSISEQLGQIPANKKLIAFGYSMGGYLALLGALTHKFAFASIITLGTKLVWDEKIAQKEMSFLQADIIEQKVPHLAKILSHKHGSNWKKVLELTTDFLGELGTHNYLHCEALGKIEIPVKLMIGDRDKMAGLHDTVNMYACLNNGSLAVLPFTEHALEKINVDTLIPHLQFN